MTIFVFNGEKSLILSQWFLKILEFGHQIQWTMKQFQQLFGTLSSKLNKTVLMIGMLLMVKTAGQIVEAREDNVTGADQLVIVAMLQSMI